MTPPKWKKLGLVYEPRDLHPKLRSHAANPLPVLLEGNRYRVFFSGRDAENRSSVGWMDLDLGTLQVTGVCQEPAFVHGAEGTYYSHGVSIGNCYSAGGVRYILFMGWRLPPGEHWRGEIGRLRLTEDLRLVLDSPDPFMSRDATDPISLSYPWVLRDAGGDYRMWYGSTGTWDAGNGEMLHVIRHARSEDGHVWRRMGDAVPWEIGVAQAFSRPTVLRSDDGTYEMWFSYRSGTGEAYRIGYAASADGRQWSFPARNGLDVSRAGWDAEMVEYPFVWAHRGRPYMLYNGDGYGRSGIGLAVLER